MPVRVAGQSLTDAYQMIDKASESLFARWTQHFDDAKLSPAGTALSRP